MKGQKSYLFGKNDEVLTRWHDGRFYLGQILKVRKGLLEIFPGVKVFRLMTEFRLLEVLRGHFSKSFKSVEKTKANFIK